MLFTAYDIPDKELNGFYKLTIELYHWNLFRYAGVLEWHLQGFTAILVHQTAIERTPVLVLCRL